MGAGGFHGRVRDGIGCFSPRHSHQVIQPTPPVSGGVGQVLVSLCVASKPCHGGVDDCCARWWSRAYRAIRTGQLSALPHLHTRPINVMVYHGPRGDIVLRRVSRLDAFSGYPVRT